MQTFLSRKSENREDSFSGRVKDMSPYRTGIWVSMYFFILYYLYKISQNSFLEVFKARWMVAKMVTISGFMDFEIFTEII